MNNHDYHISIIVSGTPNHAQDCISKVAEWWGNDLEGAAKNVHDRFIIHFGQTSVNFAVTEIVAGKKIVWQVTDCFLHWLKDKQEWKGHTLIWEIIQEGDALAVHFTQTGLAPGIECYDNCEKGWNFYIGQSLLKLINTGKGEPDTRKENRAGA